MHTADRGRIYYGWTLLVSLGVMIVPVGQEPGWNRTQLSLGYSIALLVSGVLGYPIGRWVDRKGARGVLASGAVLAGLALILLSRIDRPWQWYLLWGCGLDVAGAMTQYSVSFTVVANWFHWRRGSAMALFTVRRHPEDVGLFPDGAPSAAEAATTPLTGVGTRPAMRRLPFWTLTLTNLVAQVGSNVLFAHQVAYMIDRGQDPVVAATLAGMVGMVGMASLPGRYVFNALSERFPPQRLLGISQAVLPLGVALLALASSTGGLIASVRAEHFGRRTFGTISTIQGYPGLGGAALGPVLTGWMYDRSGSYHLTFAVVASLYVLGAGAMFATPKPRPSTRD